MGKTRQGTLLWSTKQTCRAIGITERTLRTYRKILGIYPRKIKGSRQYYYLDRDVQKMLSLKAYPKRPGEVVRTIRKRLEILEELGEI